MADETTEDHWGFRLAWPKLGDSPFVRPVNWHSAGSVDQHPQRRLAIMRSGYKWAADHLIQVCTNAHGRRHFLLYPAVFNYRQFIELSLKQLISEYGPACGVEPNWRTHDLRVLGAALFEVLESVGHPLDDSDAAVREIIDTFSDIDPGSFAFRYPTDTKGNVITLPEDMDLLELARVMDGLESYFDGCDGYLSQR